MTFSEHDISELGLRQLAPDALGRAVIAFNGFSELFGHDWVNAVFGTGRAPALVLYVTSLWEGWASIRDLKGATKIIARWKHGMATEGVSAEVVVAAYFVRKGAQVQLFPPVGKREADLRFRTEREWVYCEISHRGMSSARTKG